MPDSDPLELFSYTYLTPMKDSYKKLSLSSSSKAPAKRGNQGPFVQSVVSLTSSLRVILVTVLADSIYNILIFFCFFSKKYKNICISLDVNFKDVVSFEQLGPDKYFLISLRKHFNEYPQHMFLWRNKKNIIPFWLKKVPYLELGAAYMYNET